MNKFKKLTPVLLLTFVNTLGFSVLIPVLPFLVKQYGASEIVFGFLIAAYSAFQFLAAPVLGAMSDKWGRKPILLITQIGTFLSWLIFAGAYFLPDMMWLGLALPLWVIFLSRILDGVTGGNVSTTNAYLSDITSKEDKAQAFGILGATFGVGMIIGPAIGGITMSFAWGFLGTALFSIFLSLITLITVWFWLPESLPETDRAETMDFNLWRQINIWQRIQRWKENALIQIVLRARLAFGIVLASYTSIITLYIIDQFGLNERELGWFLLFVGSFLIFNQLILVKPIVKQLGEFPTLLLGQLLMVIGLFLMPLTSELWIYVLFYYLTNLGVSVSLPTIMAILTNQVGPKEQGQITGVTESISAFCLATAPILAGWLYYLLGGFAFWVFAGFMLLTLLFFSLGYWRCRRE